MANNHPNDNAYIRGERHVLRVAKIHSKHEDGTPEDVTIMRDSDVAEIIGGEEFMTLYMPAIVAEPEKK